jgi:Glycosyltransferase family 92
VYLTEWPEAFSNGVQIKAYVDAINKVKYKTKWLAIIDPDEFLFPVNGNNLVKFLKDYENYAAVCVNWQMYGTSFVEKILHGNLLIESLCRKAPKNHRENIHVKSIVRPECVESFTNPHSCCFKPGFFQVDSNKQEFSGPYSPNILIDKIRINHYWSRDEEFFQRVKINRRQGWGEDISEIINRWNILNSEEDEEKEIFKFIPKLRKKMF